MADSYFRCEEYTGDGQRCSRPAKFSASWTKTNIYGRQTTHTRKLCGVHARGMKSKYPNRKIDKF